MVSVTDADSDADHIQVSYEIIPSPHSHLFELKPRGQHCDVILTDQLDADIVSNETVATVVYSIMVSSTLLWEILRLTRWGCICGRVPSLTWV